MYSYKLLLLPLLVILITATTWQDCLNSLKPLDADYQEGTALFNSYTGTGGQFLAIRNSFKKLARDLDAAKSNVTSAGIPTQAEADKFRLYKCSTPMPADFRAYAAALGNKKSTVASSGLRNEFCYYLEDLRARDAAFADAWIAKSPNAAYRNASLSCKSGYDAVWKKCKSDVGCPTS